MARGTRPAPRWARHQIVAGYLSIVASVAMFVAAGIGWEPYGKEIDFGILPLALLLTGVYVIFQLNISRLLRGLDPESKEEGE